MLELGIAEHSSGGIDQRDAMAERLAGPVRQRVHVEARLPLRRHEARLSQQPRGTLLIESIAQAAVDDGDDERHEEPDDDQRADEQPLCEFHV